MKTLNEQYQLIKEGKGHKGVFLNEAKRQFPNYIRNAATFEETSTILKQKGIINENLVGITPINTIESSKKESFELAFEKFLEEAKDPQIKAKEVKGKTVKSQEEDEKAELKKTSKQVEEDNKKGYDHSDKKNLDNVIYGQLMKGYYAEMKDPKNEDKTVEQIRDIVLKNLEKDPMHYVKDGQFGVKGVGYITEHPGLGTPKEPTGKYKASGYGDLKENLNPGSLAESAVRKIVRAIINEEIEEAYQLTNINIKYPKKDRKERDTPSTPNPVRIPALLVKKLERRGLTVEDGVVKIPKLLQTQIEQKKIDFIKDLSLNKGTYPYFKALTDSSNYISTSDSSMFKFRNAKPNEDGSITITPSMVKESIEKELAAINKEAEHEILSSKLEKIDAAIEKRKSQLNKLDEDEDMKNLTDAKKVKEISKDIKALEKAKAKIEKMMSKDKGKKKEVIEDGAEDPMMDEVEVDEAAGDLDHTNLSKSNAELVKIKGTLDTISKTDILEDEEESEY